ncbi:MAG: Ig-like domain-containing protein, partial [Thermoplasmata archaeon]|nr:Ig-like domain-containing protein [Thermoplasmata archaeon]
MQKSVFVALIISAAVFSSAFLGLAEGPKDGTQGVPTIIGTSPTNGATGVSITGTYTVTWSEAVNIGMTNIIPSPTVLGTWGTINSISWTYTGATWATFSLITLTFSGWTSVSTGEPCGGEVKTFTTNDGVAPYIVTMVPADGTIGASTTSTISAQWSEAMNPLYGSISFSPMIFTGSWVWSAGNTVYTYSGAVFNPSTSYTATFVGFQDATGTPANGDLIKMFTTNDGVAPTITTIVPADGATGVAVNSNVVVTWSESMNSSAGTVNISPAPLIAGTWAWSAGNTIRTYSGATWNGATYTLTFSSFKDVSGMSAGGDLVKAFTVIAPPPVSMENIVPADGATGVSQTASVVVTWAEAMNPALGSVSIVPAPLVAGTWAWSVGNSVYTYSGAIWPGGQLITLTFNNFMSAAGGTASGDLVKIFTTTEIAPTIVTIVPADGATGVLTNANIIVRWSEPMSNTVGTVNIVPVPPINGIWAWSANRIWYNYTGATWSYATMYSLTFTGFKDTMGTAASGDLSKQFTTLAGPPPTTKATGVNVMKSGTNNVVISWTNPSATDFWDIYASTNKTSVKQPGNLLGTVNMGTGSYT